jgi:flagellin
MDVRGLADLALSAGLRTQSDLQTLTKRLSSGLRITSSQDDPSGLAIAESLASKVHGLDEGTRQIQTAANALTVAEGAMAGISDILQRMRALVVQARSDLQSVADRGMMQAELTQLMLEINKIASNTNFNGRALLDGSASSAPLLANRIAIVANSPTGGGTTLLDQKVDPNQPSLWPGAFLPGAPQLAQSITVDSYDPVTNTLQITVVIGSQDGTFGVEQTATTQIVNGGNYRPGFLPPAPGAPSFTQVDQNGTGNPVLSFNVGILTPGDVGKTAFLVTLPGQQKNPGGTLYVNSGNAEGSVVGIDIPGLSAVNLGVNDVQLGTDLQNTAAEYRIDYAIDALSAVRAKVGAQTVTLQEEAASNQIASVATQASESAIRDLNVGATMTQFVRDQVLVNFQTRLVADSEHLSQIYATLVSDALVH